jgi:hypothetical protein
MCENSPILVTLLRCLPLLCVSLNDRRGDGFKINLTTPQSPLRVYHRCEQTVLFVRASQTLKKQAVNKKPFFT